MAEALRYERDEHGIGWITIDRPDAANALDSTARASLWTCFRQFRDDGAAGVAVITGTGDKAFCAGGDLKEMSSSQLGVPPVDFLPQLNRNFQLDKPVIAAVNGVALGGGFLLAQMADLCVAADHAKFAISEAKWGRGAPWAAPLPWLIPPRVALEMLMTGDSISAARAYELGLVNKVVPSVELRATAVELARSILANAPLTCGPADRWCTRRPSPPSPTALREPSSCSRASISARTPRRVRARSWSDVPRSGRASNNPS